MPTPSPVLLQVPVNAIAFVAEDELPVIDVTLPLLFAPIDVVPVPDVLMLVGPSATMVPVKPNALVPVPMDVVPVPLVLIATPLTVPVPLKLIPVPAPPLPVIVVTLPDVLLPIFVVNAAAVVLMLAVDPVRPSVLPVLPIDVTPALEAVLIFVAPAIVTRTPVTGAVPMPTSWPSADGPPICVVPPVSTMLIETPGHELDVPRIPTPQHVVPLVDSLAPLINTAGIVPERFVR